MVKDFNILGIAGHGAGDPGASGNGYKEADKTREFISLLKDELSCYANVYVYPTDRNAYKDIKAGVFKKILNEYFPNVKFDYVYEGHFNCFNISAYGAECFVVPEEKGITVEQEYMKRMDKYFKLRDNDNIFDGVKRERFLVIKTLKAMGISGSLHEMCFIDNSNDMKIYEANKKAIAKDVAEGIAVGVGLVKSKTPAAKPTPVKPQNQGTLFEKNDKVVLSKNATDYQGADKGKDIPEDYKGKTYTVKNISSDGKCLLLKELNSWVLAKECTKKTVEEKKNFFPEKGYFCLGDKHVNVGKISKFMYDTFPSYTSKQALGNYYGPKVKASITEFQKRTGLKQDGCVGPITLCELIKYGFTY